MSRMNRDKHKGGRNETLLSQMSRNQMRQRSASLTMFLDSDEDEMAS